MDLNFLQPLWNKIMSMVSIGAFKDTSAAQWDVWGDLKILRESTPLGLTSADEVFALAMESLIYSEMITMVPGDNGFQSGPAWRARHQYHSIQTVFDDEINVDVLRATGPRFTRWYEYTSTRLASGDWEPGTYTDFTGFSRLVIDQRWRQFSNVDIKFHRNLTVLTGSNGCGKSTLLGILAQHFSWNLPLLAAPRANNFYSDSIAPSEVPPLPSPTLIPPSALRTSIGSLKYTWGQESTIHASSSYEPRTQVEATEQPQMSGLFIPSHRVLPRYEAMRTVSMAFPTRKKLLDQYLSSFQTRQGQDDNSTGMTAWMMKEALISAAMHSSDSGKMQTNTYAGETFDGFVRVLRKVLPADFEFEGLEVQQPDLIVKAGGSRFLLESLSGGLHAIFDLSWQIYLLSDSVQDFTVCIDEPENHLHPGLQRTLLPGLLAAFPTTCFIVATHSPFIITSIRESHVYSLLPGPDGIESSLVDSVSMASTPDRVLMQVLGLDSTLPQWAESALETALGKVPPDPTSADLRHLRKKLTDLGLRDQFPAAVEALSEHNAQD